MSTNNQNQINLNPEYSINNQNEQNQIFFQVQALQQENLLLKQQNQILLQQQNNILTPAASATERNTEPEVIHPTKAFVMDVQTNDRIPDFYFKEMKMSIWKFSFWIVMMFCLLGGISYFIYEVVVNKFSPWIFLPFLVAMVFSFFLFLMGLSDYRNFKRENKNVSQSLDVLNTSNFLLKVYKKLVTAPIVINWTAASLYLVLGFSILFTFIFTYLINLINNGAIHISHISFSNLVLIQNPNDLNDPINRQTPMYAVIGFGTLLCFVFISHLMLVTSAKIRLDRINVYYKEPIITNDDELKLKQSAFKKGLIVFCILLVIIGLILLIIYLVVFRNKRYRNFIRNEVPINAQN
ncbi:hypothetical protein OF377_01675 [Ureaplasma sp. ES3154-GEN]|uniref:MSC_0882 family membrane protein n=1 Tax=Ureaplasma sp. ES3154-GEN TaxID=2984844 RepID=UPI0021E85F9F|nr:hypothetical protein [Ureaplasma sp. ES3154-GEN]MCV3743596.1 hypothetical protein [Ureaplasma sp. ES3154-GEN]